ncbi:MAG TPA: Wzz/FepE/Etk N-terminal domain-containing protein [Candidatus Hydrogenedentes bacterium]|nr:Wzz/FepE/Etk N-terminal domain-containing protein [Candidatus Hydrogenedentota bacterium]HOL77101.1 Wzz/FepE/Etk N-terminal domain-containing protein [Candidatus Hydrogenedentota bacterium]HPO86980.1 Wzz/FepE/Etk N-terminal domain-containing protein [Candidatus Hydrogenedentota bacterium]
MDQRQIFLRDILTVLFKRKGFIVSFAIVVIVLVAAGNYVWPKTYESVAKVQVMRGRETVGVDPTVLEGAAMPMVQLTNYDVNTTIDLVTSNDVLCCAALCKRRSLIGG